MHALRLFALVALVAVPAWASTSTPLLSALRAEAVTSVTAVMRATSASHTGEGTLYFGTKDGGRDPKAWQFTVLIGRHGASDLEAPVEGLEPSTRYFFTFSVKTPDGEEWASSSASFSTPAARTVVADAGATSGRPVGPARGVVDTQPASRWQDGLLSGNGTIGALVFGDPIDERVVLTHERLFLPLHEPLPPVNTAQHLPRIRELISSGHYQAAADLVVEQAQAEGYGPKRWTDPFIPAFDLMVRMAEPAGAIRNYLRTVDYPTGVVAVTWRDDAGDFERRVFVSRRHNALVLSIRGLSGATVSADVGLVQRPIDKVNTYWREQEKFARGIGPIEVEAAKGLANGVTGASGKDSDPGTWWLTYRSGYRSGPGGYQGAARLTVTGGQATLRGRFVEVRGAREVLVVLSIEALAHFDKASWDGLLRMLQPLERSFEPLLAAHEAIHRPLFERVRLDLDADPLRRRRPSQELLQSGADGALRPATLEAVFDAGRYETLSSSGELPPNLQGKWTGTWGGDWSSDYTLNGNVQVAVASLLQGNLAECLLGLFDYLESMLPASRENARRMYGARGILVASRTTTHGYNNHFDRTWPMTFWTAGAGWFSRFYWDYYLYTGDREFLARRALPFMAEAAAFYEDFLLEGADGRLHFNPSYSPENNPGNSRSQACIDATMDMAVARELLTNVIDGSRQLGVNAALVPRWQRMLDRLPAYQVNGDGAVKEWSWPTLDDNYEHRHNSHLYALFFGPDREVDANPSLRRAFQRAIDLRMAERKKQGGGVMAFGAIQLGQAAASLGDGQAALQILEWLAAKHYFRGLATSHDPGPEIFNADLSGGLPDLVMRMLVQSAPGQLMLLPALPAAWSAGTLEGARAQGQIEVKSLRWNGQSVDLSLRSDVAQQLLLSVPRPIVSLRESGREVGTPGADARQRRISLPAGCDVLLSIKVGS